MINEKLKNLREQILAEIVPLVIDNESGVDQFGLLLRIIQAGGASNEIYNRAHESAKRIEDKAERLDALLSLVDEIDIESRQTEAGPQSNDEISQVQDQPGGEKVEDAPQQENNENGNDPLIYDPTQE